VKCHRIYKYSRGDIIKGLGGKIMIPEVTRVQLNEDKSGKFEYCKYCVESCRLPSAYYDGITGLPNQTLFQRDLKQLINNGIDKKGALLLLQISDFKILNKTLGFKLGDQVLSNLAEKIGSIINSCGNMYRGDNDEFYIILPNAEYKESVTSVCNKIIEEAAKTIQINNFKTKVSVKIGATFFPQDGSEVEELVRNVGIAVYEIKNNEKSFCFFNSSMNYMLQRNKAIEENLTEALERGEFELHYQPQIDIKTKRVKGLEALLRWNNAQLGRVSPEEFIPVAEKTGLIIPIGYWIIKSVCLQNDKWKKLKYEYESISINLSPIQLNQIDFVNGVANVLNINQREMSWLHMEITEGTLIRSFDETISKLLALKEMNINIALDDFGKGFSSLSYLKRLPIGTLKIDKSFIDDIETNFNDRVIVESVISMAHKLNLQVVAEGVEVEKQVELLREMSCDVIQGYYYSKPLSADKIGGFLEEYSKSLQKVSTCLPIPVY
jgi:diguanylate cyclase (GGDEF)-like protein